MSLQIALVVFSVFSIYSLILFVIMGFDKTENRMRDFKRKSNAILCLIVAAIALVRVLELLFFTGAT